MHGVVGSPLLFSSDPGAMSAVISRATQRSASACEKAYILLQSRGSYIQMAADRVRWVGVVKRVGRKGA